MCLCQAAVVFDEELDAFPVPGAEVTYAPCAAHHVFAEGSFEHCATVLFHPPRIGAGQVMADRALGFNASTQLVYDVDRLSGWAPFAG